MAVKRCKHGHKLTEATTYLRATGYRECIQCAKRRAAESHERKNQ